MRCDAILRRPFRSTTKFVGTKKADASKDYRLGKLRTVSVLSKFDSYGSEISE